jgi:HK97 family phage prohead protease
MIPSVSSYAAVLQNPFENSGPLYGIFEGYASSFNIDLQQDQIHPQAFSSIHKSFKNESSFFLPLFYEHNREKVLGKVYAIENDTHGLYVKIHVSLDENWKKDIFYQVQKGLLRYLSIGFFVKTFSKENGIRHIYALDLKEISLVQKPANQSAFLMLATSVLSVLQHTQEKQYQNHFNFRHHNDPSSLERCIHIPK